MSSSFASLLAAKGALLLDGAMGSELQRAGVDTSLPLWSALALLRAPHAVRGIHRAYLEAGADIITTNTFRTNLRTLRRAGREEEWEDLNLLAVRLAFEARDWYPIERPVLIAASIAPVEDCYSPGLVPAEAELREEHERQARLLAGSGVDLLLLETMNCIREGIAASRAAAATGKSWAVSFVCDNEGNLLSGESLADAARAVEPLGPAAIMVNCVSARFIRRPLEILRSATTLPAGLYANVGTPAKEAGWKFSEEATMEEYTALVPEWLRLGARIIGGCCGTTPDHIAGMRNALREWNGNRNRKR